MAPGFLFDACISATKMKETTKGKRREEFHFEMAEGRREGAAGGRDVHVCVCLERKENYVFSSLTVQLQHFN